MNKHILPFSTNSIKAFYFDKAEKLQIGKNSIVINLSNSRLHSLNIPIVSIAPWRSLLLPSQWTVNGESIVVIDTVKGSNLQEDCIHQWKKYSDINNDYPANIPLYISPQYSTGIKSFNPLKSKKEPRIIHNDAKHGKLMPGKHSNEHNYEIKLNLWFAPAGTHCLIHSVHPFLELHTQIHGKGHMQKFKSNDLSTLYEDVVMKPGYTHEPFFTIKSDHQWEYPWHQYYSETDCLWMAIEFHPI